MEDERTFDDSTISSSGITPTDKLRASYKVQYRGGREWNDGLVDPSFPCMITRSSDPPLLRDVDTRFDVQQSGGDSPLCYYPKDHDRRFDTSKPDCALPGIPSRDRRFDKASAPASSGLPPMPSRTRDIFIPTVWQTRVSDGVDGDSTTRKWRLKRVWESSKDPELVIEDIEPDFVVDESDLESALSSLLGVPAIIWLYPTSEDDEDTVTLATEIDSDFSEFSISDRSLAGDRWGATADDKLVKQPWRIQRVWDREGEICRIDAERSMDRIGLMEIFSSDDVMPNDSLSMEYSHDDTLSKAESLPVSLPLADALKEVDEDYDEAKLNDTSENDYHQEPGDCSISSWISGHESASFVEEDPLDENEFEASLSGPEFDDEEEDEEETTSEIDEIREKLRQLEMMIQLLIQNDDSKGEKRKAYKKMQAKCVEHLNDLSSQLAKLDGDKAATSCQILENIPTELFKIGSGKDESDEEDVPSRKQSVIRKKLRKTEKQMNRMITEDGNQIKEKKAYKKLEEKRNGLLKELGMKVQPLEDGPQRSRACNKNSRTETCLPRYILFSVI